MSSKIEMGFAKPEEIEDMIVLVEQLFSIEKDFVSDSEKQRTGMKMIMEHPDNQLFVVRDNGRLIGMCSMQVLISTAEGGKSGLIEDLVIDNNYRQMGIGSKFMEFLVNYAKEKGYKRLQLLADRDNTPALNFYKKENWASTNLCGLMYKV